MKKFTKQEAKKEMAELIDAYKRQYPHGGVAFLTGSSLVGNKNGDSERFWQLKKIIEAT